MEENGKVRIALGQIGSPGGGREALNRAAEEMAKAAAEAKAGLLCLPELSSCGYFIRREELLQAAVPAEEEARRIGKTAKKYGISIISGYPERKGDRIYNACVAVGAGGELIGNARKVNLWKSEKRRFSEGNDFPVFDTCAGKAAVILCYDLEFPEPARIACMRGAKIIFCPAAWSRPASRRWEVDLAGAALYNLAFAAGANYEDEFCCGDSCVYGPDGKKREPAEVICLAGPDGEKRGAEGETSPAGPDGCKAGEHKVLLFEIDLGETDRERERIPYYEDWKGELYGEMIRGL